MSSAFKAILFLLVINAFSVCAQSDSAAKKYNAPAWIKMMDDENVNYYQAVQSFEDYLKSNSIIDSESEEEMMGADKRERREYEREMKRKNQPVITEEDRRKLVEKEFIAYQIKRFRNWMNEVKPFVQEDGHVLSNDEKIRIWQKQQDEVKSNPARK